MNPSIAELEAECDRCLEPSDALTEFTTVDGETLLLCDDCLQEAEDEADYEGDLPDYEC